MSCSWIFAFLRFFLLFNISVTSATSGGPFITTPSQTFTVQLFHEVKLPCKVVNNVADEPIFWLREKALIFIGGSKLPEFFREHYELNDNSTLYIRNFTIDLAGTYTCSVQNQIISHKVGLKGVLPEKIQMKQTETITLPCHPALKNSTKVIRGSDFEWVMDNEVPIYSQGKLSLFFNLVVAKDKYIIENSSLILREPPVGYTRLTCRLIRLNTNYTYLLQVKPSPPKNYCHQKQIYYDQNGNKTVELPCRPFEKPLSENANYTWVLRNDYQSLEIISLNQRILSQHDTAGYNITEKGYLVIPNFIPMMDNHYECYLSTKAANTLKIEYFSSITDGDELYYLNEIHRSGNQSINVTEGANITLKCPTNKPDFVWIRNGRDYLFISGSAVKSSNTNGLEMHHDKPWLIISNFSYALGGYYECRSSAGLQYGYTIGQKRIEINQSVGNENLNKQTYVAELGLMVDLDCSIDDVDGSNKSHFVWIRNGAELLFINENPIRRSNTRKLIIDEDKRSLVITDFSVSMIGIYTCLTSSGKTYVYNLKTPPENESKFKTQTLFVDYASRNTVLPCPIANDYVVPNTSYEWIFLPEANIAKLSLLFVNQVDFTTAPFQGLYEINDDRSLVILVMNAETYGLYQCRWTNGEEFTYNITRDIKWRNKTISVKEGENVTLPCPLEDPKDRELNAVDWEIMLDDGYTGAFQFLDGKMIPPPSSYVLHDNLNLAQDKQSLIVFNVTSSMEGYYFCVLFRSSTYYKYTLRVN
ncbi:uncharacterized protein LOC135833200 isoform X2 [Planococcus citri]